MKERFANTYKFAKIVCENFEIKNLGEYHHLYVQGDTLLLANMYLKIYELFSALGLAWQVALTNKRPKLDLLTDTYMLLMLEKDI